VQGGLRHRDSEHRGAGAARTRVDVGVQLEVVLPAKELLADLALELAAPAVRGDVSAQVPLAGEHLLTHRNQAKSQRHTRDITGPARARDVWPVQEVQEAHGDWFLGKDAPKKPLICITKIQREL